MSGYSAYFGEKDFEHGEIPAVGILLTNLGTPETPTAEGLRPYLAEFLSDPRVIELPRWQWWPILNLFVLRRRPKESAKLYSNVWTEEGSPLLAITRRIAEKVDASLSESIGSPFHVAVGMRYGQPSIARALHELRGRGCRRLLVLPLYPQYSATTTATTFDAVTAELTRWRWIPELRTIHSYHDEPGYIRALAGSVRETWAQGGPSRKLLFSFHGIPRRYFENGDPYHCLCHKTARLVAEELGLETDRYEVAFQSLFGREEWLKPYTENTIRAMAASGVDGLDVLCAGFSADCLETLDEIDREYRKVWVEAGGDDARYRYIRALNDRPAHIAFLSDLLLRNLGGWVSSAADWNEDEAREKRKSSRERAAELASKAVMADAGYGEDLDG
jgi:ferrochelatase